jgi:hypothetical protein
MAQNAIQWKLLLQRVKELEEEARALRSLVTSNRRSRIKQTRRLNYLLTILLTALAAIGVTEWRDIPEKISQKVNTELATRVPEEVKDQLALRVPTAVEREFAENSKN